MAVSVDTVYQKVLALANKEQRGYITPQEFNLFADQAQMEIFEQYFYDLNQFKRRSGNDTEYTDPVEIINKKLYLFKRIFSGLANGYDLSGVSDFYMLSDVYDNTGTSTVIGGYEGSKVVEEVDHFDLIKTQNSPLTRATVDRPIYYIRDNIIYFIPNNPVGNYGGYYIRKPAKPNWTYLIDSTNQTALFNPDINAGWQDFELHPSEEPKLVIKILQLAGVSIKDFNLAQLAGQKEASVIQQEKQ